MKKNVIFLCFVWLLSLSAIASDAVGGIEFAHVSWSEAVAKAKAEKKLIFIDFYTQWCGPCMNMAQEVFVLPTVGNYYNTHFVNLKIDAETGEGKELAQKYGVKSYPTYAFIDPLTQELVHRSSSRQSGEAFIKTAANALNPKTRSPYLMAEFEKGNKERAFLINYIEYMKSIYRQDDVRKAFDLLISTGASLDQADIWNLYVNSINGPSNPYLLQVSEKYDHFVRLYGKEAVDKKLAAETTYMPLAELDKLCDFKGKKFNRDMIEINSVLRNKDYATAITRIDALIADPATDRQQLIDRLKFMVRGGISESSPAEWSKKCLEYLQFIAYNSAERRDPYIHQEYASALEQYLRLTSSKADFPKSVLTAPTTGKSAYTMRPDNLKAKPIKKK
ncbi:MAG: thioredoxin family protein [Bacteroidales bacterium]